MYHYNVPYVLLMFNLINASSTCNRDVSNLLSFTTEKKSHSIRVVSYNIRGESQLDRQNGNSWEHRKYQIQCLLNFYSPDIIGLQEVSISYIPDLEQLFPNYSIISFDMTQKDKDAVLLIKNDRFDVKKINYFWLAQDPTNEQSLAWNSKATRIVVYAKVFDRQSKNECYVLCTHFDGYATEARFESAKLLSKQQKIIRENLPVIVLGDFNLFTDEDGETIYTELVRDDELVDVRDLAPRQHFGPDGTWIGWSYDAAAVPPGSIGNRLDQIFVHGFDVLKEGVLDIKIATNERLIEPGKLDLNVSYPSDHLPVIADICFQ